MMNGKSGQAALLVILLSLLGLTVGLGVISRSLSDIKQTTTTDSGAKALAAAEAMAQYAATQTNSSPPDCSDVVYSPYSVTTFSGIKELWYGICTTTQSYSENLNVNPGDVVSFDLSAFSGSVKSVNVLWNSTSSVEMTQVGKNNNVVRYALNPAGSSNTVNNFSLSPGTSGCFDDPDKTCPTNSIYSSCFNVGPVSNNGNIKDDKVLRIRAINFSTPIRVCGVGNGNKATIDNPVTTYIGKAVATDGTVRRVQLTKSAAALPGIFDYTLYTEGTLQK